MEVSSFLIAAAILCGMVWLIFTIAFIGMGISDQDHEPLGYGFFSIFGAVTGVLVTSAFWAAKVVAICDTGICQ